MRRSAFGKRLDDVCTGHDPNDEQRDFGHHDRPSIASDASEFEQEAFDILVPPSGVLGIYQPLLGNIKVLKMGGPHMKITHLSDERYLHRGTTTVVVMWPLWCQHLMMVRNPIANLQVGRGTSTP